MKYVVQTKPIINARNGLNKSLGDLFKPELKTNAGWITARMASDDLEELKGRVIKAIEEGQFNNQKVRIVQVVCEFQTSVKVVEGKE